MPTVKKGESKQAWLGRCIPVVLKEGTAKNQKQAQAICFDMYARANGGKQGRRPLKPKK